MNLSGFSVKRPVTALMIVLVIILLGSVSMANIQTDLFPNVNVPVAAVSVRFSGAGPEEVENIVTRNIENVLATVSNVDTLSSISSDGSALIIVQFIQSVNMDAAILEMREKLDMITPYFPSDVSPPLIIKFDPNLIPMAGYSVSLEGADTRESTRWADEVLKPRLERIEGVANVEVSGGSRDEIRITPDFPVMAALGITPESLAQAIMANNLNLPGGTVTDGSMSYNVKTTGALRSLEDIRELYVFSPLKMQPVALNEFADVDFYDTNTQTYSRVNGNDSITLTLQKQSEYNTVQVMENVFREVEDILTDYPDASFVSIFDQSKYISLMVGNVSLNGLIGAVLAVIILFIFLKDFRPTLIIGVAIPVSILAAFIMIYFSGITLNIVSMGGLALGIGMLVDNSIVVLENIYRLRSEGMGRKEAAIEGGKTIAGAIIASTLTTISVFLPVVFLSGMTADIFKEMALTITIALLASLLISLTFVPMLASRTLRADTSTHHRLMESIKKQYVRLLRWSLKKRIAIVVITVVLFSSSVYGVFQMGAEFFPDSDQGQFQISVVMPEGTGYADTISTIQKIEAILQEYPEIEVISANVSDSPGFMGFATGGVNTGTVTVTLVPVSQRNLTTKQLADDIRNKIQGMDGAEMSVDAQGMTGMNFLIGSGIEIEIQGNDLAVLESITQDLFPLVQGTEGIAEAHSSIERSSSEILIHPDSFKTASAGLSVYQIAENVRMQIQGIFATTARINNLDYTVRIMSTEKDKDALGGILLPSPFSPATGIKLSDVADIRLDEGYNAISRKNQQRLVTISATLTDGYDPGNVGKALEGIVGDYAIPAGYTVELAGQNREIQNAFKDLYLALGLGVLLIYMIMAAQFESLKYPFIIILSIPLAFTGGFFSLLLLDIPLSVTALIGMIVLAGIVVNNGIVLVDYINRLRAKGRTVQEAILEAGPVRMRPIFMTTLTTILALIPLSLGIGEGTEMLIPMSVTVIGGLLFSTLLTLVLIPTVYSLLTRRDT
ncbi:MAG: efflux RND transporter permease subunit [Clostridia bacterium]